MEIWSFISNFTVSNVGIIIKTDNQRLLKQYKDKNGYCYVNYKKNNRTHHFLVHRLVALAFIPNPLNKPEVNHKDNNPSNNIVDNLEWVTKKENIQYAAKQGRIRNRFTGKLCKVV